MVGWTDRLPARMARMPLRHNCRRVAPSLPAARSDGRTDADGWRRRIIHLLATTPPNPGFLVHLSLVSPHSSKRLCVLKKIFHVIGQILACRRLLPAANIHVEGHIHGVALPTGGGRQVCLQIISQQFRSRCTRLASSCPKRKARCRSRAARGLGFSSNSTVE